MDSNKCNDTGWETFHLSVPTHDITNVTNSGKYQFPTVNINIAEVYVNNSTDTPTVKMPASHQT
jgi:hypothetical protein